MNVNLDREGCISCGACVAVCPEVFRMGDDGTAEVYAENIPEGLTEDVESAADGCPVAVISVE